MVNIKDYKKYNQDLKCSGMSDEELVKHFNEIGIAERRIYDMPVNTKEIISMKYLRGSGLEIGAGNFPTKLYGNATCKYADVSNESYYNSKGVEQDLLLDISKGGFWLSESELSVKYDFIIASHVLEHVNSLIRSLRLLSSMLENDGILYVVVPNKSFDWDKDWLKNYSYMHHIFEFIFPKMFLPIHRKNFQNHFKKMQSLGVTWAQEFDGHADVVLDSKKLNKFDYLYHKHSYSFEGWLNIFMKISRFFCKDLELIYVSGCFERNDVHLVFRKKII